MGVVPDEGKKTPKDVRIGNAVTACLTIRMAVNCGMNRELPVAGVPDGYGNPVIRFKNSDPAKARLSRTLAASVTEEARAVSGVCSS